MIPASDDDIHYNIGNNLEKLGSCHNSDDELVFVIYQLTLAALLAFDRRTFLHELKDYFLVAPNTNDPVLKHMPCNVYKMFIRSLVKEKRISFELDTCGNTVYFLTLDQALSARNVCCDPI